MDRPTRIAFLSEHASPLALRGGEDAGGQNVYVDEVSRNLARRGYAVDVFTRHDSPASPTVVPCSPGVRVIHLPVGPAEFRLKDQLWPLMPAFRNAFLDFMAHDEVRYDLIHGNFWMSGWVATELGRRLTIPVVQIFHATGKTKRRYQGSLDTSPPERIAVETAIVRDADRLIAQCPAEWSELVEDYGAEPEKVVVIPSAVNTQVFRPVDRAEARQRLGLDSRDFVVVYVGRMLPRKDVRNVVRAVAQLIRWCESFQTPSFPSIKLLLVGGETEAPNPSATPEIDVLQQLVAELGVGEHVSFVGKRQQDVLRDYYSAGNVVVTTPWYEPFGLTPLEAMACGRPVIGSAVGGITYTVADGKTGFLVPPRDPAALAIHLYQLLMEPELAEQMGREARARVEQEFTWPIVAMRTATLYESLLAPAHFRLWSTPSVTAALLATNSDSQPAGGGE